MGYSPATISAIVPTYNRSGMLRECLDSLLAQTVPVSQLIVVDDGSTDDTKAVIGTYGEKVTYLAKANGGKAAALNYALAHCTSDYVWICDDDDVAAPDGLEHLARALDENPSAGFSFGRYDLFEDRQGTRHFSDPGILVHDDEPNIKLLFLEQMITCQFAMLVRRDLYSQVGPFREDLLRSQDYDMILRLVRAVPGVRLQKTVFFQRQHLGLRGPKDDTFVATEKEVKWLKYDGQIFNEIRVAYPLDYFVPSFAQTWSAKAKHRAALLERGGIFARRALWPEAIDDFEAAARYSQVPLAPEETRLLETLISSEFSWKILRADPDRIGHLRKISALNIAGRQLVAAASRSLVWMARIRLAQGKLNSAFQGGRLLIALNGWGGFIDRLRKSAQTRQTAPQLAPLSPAVLDQKLALAEQAVEAISQSLLQLEPVHDERGAYRDNQGRHKSDGLEESRRA